MQLDVKTLFLLNIVVAFVTVGVSFFSWFYHRDMPGLRGWSIGLTLAAVGSLISSLRMPTSPIALAIVGNTLMVAGYATVWLSVRRFNEGPFELGRVTLAIALFAVPFTVATLLGADVRTQVLMVSGAIAILSLLAAWELFHSRAREPLASRIPTATAFAVIALAMLARAGFSLFGEQPHADTAISDPTQGPALFINTVCLVAVTLGLL